MTKNELYHLLTHPQELEAEHIPALEQLVQLYPYVASFIYIYLYALAKTEDIRYHAELKRLALYLPSRESLYCLVHGIVVSQQTPRQALSPDRRLGLIDNFLEQARNAGEDLPDELSFYPTETSDYFNSEGDRYTPTSTLSPKQASALDPAQAQSQTPYPTKPNKGQRERMDKNYPREQTDSPPEQELFTETLAKIYIQQRKYRRALTILERLYLHYPQKNRYFADQIRFLRRLVENNIEHKD